MPIVLKIKLRDAEIKPREGLDISSGRERGWRYEIGRNRMKWTAKNHRSKQEERKMAKQLEIEVSWKGRVLRKEKKNKAKMKN